MSVISLHGESTVQIEDEADPLDEPLLSETGHPIHSIVPIHSVARGAAEAQACGCTTLRCHTWSAALRGVQESALQQCTGHEGQQLAELAQLVEFC